MRLLHLFSPLEEICVLFDDADRPLEFSVWSENDVTADAIYTAQAVRQVPSGWFLDLGKGRSAYMNAASFYLKPDGSVCQKSLTEGDKLLVKIVHPEITDKEAEATPKVTLAGKTVVLTPAEQAPSFSRQLTAEQSERLRARFPQTGVLFRTAAGQAELSEIESEIVSLTETWRNILKNNDKTGELYRPEKDVFRYVSEYSTKMKEISTNDAETAAALKRAGFTVAFKARGIQSAEKTTDIFDEIKAVRIALPSGGFLMTEQTSACVCFDVNAGSGKAAEANKEACPEILRQIRLKGLGGQMIVDFAGRKDAGMMKSLISALRADGVFIAGVSRLGLVELTVKKTKPSVFDVLSRSDRRCAARIVLKLWDAVSVSDPVVYAPACVSGIARQVKDKLEKRLGTAVEWRLSETIKTEGVDD